MSVNIFHRKFTSSSKPSAKNISFSRLTAPRVSENGKKVGLKCIIIFHLQPNHSGIKLREGDDWHFRLHKQYPPFGAKIC